MRLGDFLNTATATAPVKPVRFKVIGKGVSSSEMKTADVDAVMVFISEEERAQCQREAEKYMKEQYGAALVPDVALTDEIIYQTLHRCLRDSQSDNHITTFADTVTVLRKSLVKKVASELYTQYLDFIHEEFPDNVSTEEFEKMVVEAEKKSLAALLSEFGSSAIVRVFPSLVARFGK